MHAYMQHHHHHSHHQLTPIPAPPWLALSFQLSPQSPSPNKINSKREVMVVVSSITQLCNHNISEPITGGLLRLTFTFLSLFLLFFFSYYYY